MMTIKLKHLCYEIFLIQSEITTLTLAWYYFHSDVTQPCNINDILFWWLTKTTQWIWVDWSNKNKIIITMFLWYDSCNYVDIYSKWYILKITTHCLFCLKLKLDKGMIIIFLLKLQPCFLSLKTIKLQPWTIIVAI